MSLAVFVSSTDTYSDCWYPFFKLFKKFWPSFNGTIYLNTEEKDYTYPGLNIVCTQVRKYRKNGGEIAFGERLLLALNNVVKEEHIIYMHEDFFLEDYVDEEKILELYSLVKNLNYSYLGLTTFANHGPFLPSKETELIWDIDKSDKFRNSYQATLWRVNDFKKIIRKHEDPWHAEFYGSIRSRRTHFKYGCVNRDLFSGKDRVLPYADTTGIYRSKWIKEAVYDLFKENDIQVDYSIRGFFNKEEVKPKPASKKKSINKLINKIKSLV